MFCCSDEDIEYKARSGHRIITDRGADAVSNYSCLVIHKDIADSSHVVATFLGAWIKIKILLGLFTMLHDRFLNIYQNRNSKLDDNGENFHKLTNGASLLRRSCVARVICLSNQKATYQKSPISNIVAETLR